MVDPSITLADLAVAVSWTAPCHWGLWIEFDLGMVYFHHQSLAEISTLMEHHLMHLVFLNFLCLILPVNRKLLTFSNIFLGDENVDCVRLRSSKCTYINDCKLCESLGFVNREGCDEVKLVNKEHTMESFRKNSRRAYGINRLVRFLGCHFALQIFVGWNETSERDKLQNSSINFWHWGLWLVVTLT